MTHDDWLAQQLLDPDFRREYERIAPPYLAFLRLFEQGARLGFWYWRWWDLGQRWGWPDWWMRLGARAGWADFEDDKS